MGMFDTFRVPHNGSTLDVQSKRFSCGLDVYQPGDPVFFADAPAVSCGVACYIESHYQKEGDVPVVLVVVDGLYFDSLVLDITDDAQARAEALFQYWIRPEHKYKRLLELHSAAIQERNTYRDVAGKTGRLLYDWTHRNDNIGSKKLSGLFYRHDFENTPWEVAISELLCQAKLEALVPNELRVMVALNANTG